MECAIKGEFVILWRRQGSHVCDAVSRGLGFELGGARQTTFWRRKLGQICAKFVSLQNLWGEIFDSSWMRHNMVWRHGEILLLSYNSRVHVRNCTSTLKQYILPSMGIYEKYTLTLSEGNEGMCKTHVKGRRASSNYLGCCLCETKDAEHALTCCFYMWKLMCGRVWHSY